MTVQSAAFSPTRRPHPFRNVTSGQKCVGKILMSRGNRYAPETPPSRRFFLSLDEWDEVEFPRTPQHFDTERQDFD
jgi:hypothetical protein